MSELEKSKCPKYKDYSFYILIVVLLVLVAAGQAIFTAASPIFRSYTWLFGLICVVSGYVLNVIFYEIGKRIFGFFAGYKLVYINVLIFKVYKDEKYKSHFALSGMENYGGNCFMVPKIEKKGNCMPFLFHLGGSITCIILNVISVITCSVLSNIYNNDTIVLASLLVVTVGAVYMIINLAPVYSDSLLDGFILRMLYKKEYTDIYFNNLYNQEALINASHDFEKFDCDSYDNIFATENAYYQYYYYIHQKDYVNAEHCLDLIIENKDYAFPETITSAYADKYYFKLMKKDFKKSVEEYFLEKKEVQKACVSSFDFGVLKTTLLITSLVDVSYDYYEYLFNKIDKMHQKYRFKSIADDELDMIELALKHIEEAKPEWFKPYEYNESEDKN